MSISERKLHANRANAARSTGPRTPQGKAKSRLNAVKHGLYANTLLPLRPCDEPNFQAARAEWLGRMNPAGPSEQALAEKIVRIVWLLMRVGGGEPVPPRARMRLMVMLRELSELLRWQNARRIAVLRRAVASVNLQNDPEPPASLGPASGCPLKSKPRTGLVPPEPPKPPRTEPL